MKRLFALTRRLIRRVQRWVMFALLFQLYIFGFGLTFLFAKVFDRRLFRGEHRKLPSYWDEAEDYEPDEGRARHQS